MERISVTSKIKPALLEAITWPRAYPIDARILFAIILVVGTAIPVLFSPWHHNAFELPKSVALRCLSGIALLLLVYSRKLNRREKWWRQPLVAETMILAFVLISATAFSADASLSVWGTYDRQFGLLTWLALLGLFFITLFALDTNDKRENLLGGFILGSLPIVIYGILQGLGVDPFSWDSDGTSGVLGTMGRSNFLGSYLVLIIPLTAAGILTAKRPTLLIFLLAGQIAVLGLTQARAAWLGLLMAAVLFVILWLYTRGRRRLTIWLTLAGLILGIALIITLLFVGLPSSITESGSTAARLTIWEAMVPLLFDKPLLGYGLDAIQLPFQAVFPPELIYYQGRHLAVDRAHNLLLDIGITTGFLGLAAFIFLLLRAGWLLWRNLLAATTKQKQLLQIAIIAAVGGHLMELQFSLETIGPAVIFWLVLAAGVSSPGNHTRGAEAVENKPKKPPWKTLPIVLTLLGILVTLSVRPMLADRSYWLGLQSDPTSAKALRYFVDATEHWSIEPQYHLALAQSYWVNGQPSAAVSQAVVATQKRPTDARYWSAVGDLYARWGEIEPARLTQALAAYRRTVALAPKTAAYHTALGLILAKSGRLSEGISEIEQAVMLDATDSVAFTHLSNLYKANGQTDKAAWASSQALHWSVRNTVGDG